MKTVRVFIERGKDGSFGAYMPDDNKLPYGIIGDGNTADEAVNDFLSVYNDLKTAADKKNIPFEEVSFAFSFDLPSFLVYYANILSHKGLSKLTGISQSQLSQYISGYRKPSHKTTAKIQNALHDLGNELSRVKLI